MNLTELWPSEYSADMSVLKISNNESEYNEAGFYYLRELAILTSICGNTYRLGSDNRPRNWTRNEAILFGSLIRASHLLKGYLSEISQKRLETTLLFQRSICETLVNIMFLIKKNDENMYQEYIKYSLRFEKKLYKTILTNIAVRGYELFIESRMKKSIEKAFYKSGIKIEDIDERSKPNWGGSIKDKFTFVGLEHLYDPILGAFSHSIHGNWQDLLSHYLIYNDDGTFSPDIGSKPKPQVICGLGIILCLTLTDFVKWMIPDCPDRKRLLNRISKIDNEVREVDSLHEDYLKRKYSSDFA